MPGCGKSTVGVLLAKRLGFHFVDTDLFIQAGEGKSLQWLIEEYGMGRFGEIECQYIQRLDIKDAVIATGGSVVYYDKGMKHLQNTGSIIYMQLPLGELEKRLGNLNARGVVLEPGESLASLYERRIWLYEKWADRIINLSGLGHEQSVEAIFSVL
ncbi:MAG: shikimate kinase [Sedimentisphaerales bacterium]|nr:shikimate kinase [Sedimentisphaerales bacterium]